MTIPLIVCVLGFVIYFIGYRIPDAFVSEVGRILFAFGLLVTLLGAAATKLF